MPAKSVKTLQQLYLNGLAFLKLMHDMLKVGLTDFLSPRFGHCTAMLISSALVGSAMSWRHRSPNAPFEPIVANIVGILVDGVGR